MEKEFIVKVKDFDEKTDPTKVHNWKIGEINYTVNVEEYTFDPKPRALNLRRSCNEDSINSGDPVRVRNLVESPIMTVVEIRQENDAKRQRMVEVVDVIWFDQFRNVKTAGIRLDLVEKVNKSETSKPKFSDVSIVTSDLVFRRLCSIGEKGLAVRYLKTMTGLGVKEAQDIVDKTST
jgi:ribosomal protein L7/L12